LLKKNLQLQYNMKIINEWILMNYINLWIL
jgi:hypothetical protein